MREDTITIFVQALKNASTNGMLFEFCKSFLEDATVGTHTSDQEVREAIVFANREWDL